MSFTANAPKATRINFRTDEETKEEANSIFAKLGLDMSTALNMFLQQTINDQGLPFKPTLSKFEKSVLKAADGPTRSFDNVDDLMKELRGTATS
ncbi:type II toxin-antitoxin system RelB/DinJ family antitoxin [Bifidobacterium sp. ESL0769]|uniref:type II toxin-antitoxin system RelB/DinJ family antitoxin n=1 Tax=Bifidobacterium sp. ESL0769 TaxID=2983229 RepID=UPI0023F7127F|nr:type II toxin-antitoxin system RelB/DinJ family antitoxin [Bifidobacterium sp. ESL0769]WEV68218.1 type II toxin-antitoxin system RelB/DinJ family antitoxin [Bifidobacterium sp. ESL0769]